MTPEEAQKLDAAQKRADDLLIENWALRAMLGTISVVASAQYTEDPQTKKTLDKIMRLCSEMLYPEKAKGADRGRENTV
jgi:hypothetical protein